VPGLRVGVLNLKIHDRRKHGGVLRMRAEIMHERAACGGAEQTAPLYRE